MIKKKQSIVGCVGHNGLFFLVKCVNCKLDVVVVEFLLIYDPL